MEVPKSLYCNEGEKSGRTAANAQQLVEEEGFARSIWSYHHHWSQRAFKAAEDVEAILLKL